jgi:hypothetical protein
VESNINLSFICYTWPNITPLDLDHSQLDQLTGVYRNAT